MDINKLVIQNYQNLNHMVFILLPAYTSLYGSVYETLYLIYITHIQRFLLHSFIAFVSNIVESYGRLIQSPTDHLRPEKDDLRSMALLIYIHRNISVVLLCSHDFGLGTGDVYAILNR